MLGWTEERVEQLRKLWLEGLSASQIAGVLGDGITRNAVIGKVHRLKLSGRAKPVSAAPRARPAPRPAPPRRVAAPSPAATLGASMMQRRAMAPTPPMQGATALKMDEQFALHVEIEPVPKVQELFIPVEQRLTLLELTEQTCKWPVGDPLTSDFYFCGQRSNEGKPICEFHSRRAYHQIEKKRR
jgi:GcrA cell cycle regulator